MSEPLDDLIEQVAKAEGADHRIDAALALRLAGWTHEKRKGDAKEYWREPGKDWRRYDNQCLRYTDSLDAAITLVEHVLPGWSYGVAMRGDKLSREGCDDERAYAWLKNGDQAEADAPTLALALVHATLLAIQTKGGG